MSVDSTVREADFPYYEYLPVRNEVLNEYQTIALEKKKQGKLWVWLTTIIILVVVAIAIYICFRLLFPGGLFL